MKQKVCRKRGHNNSGSRIFPKGFTLLELVIVITIIVVLMGFLFGRMRFYQEQAEKAAMEAVAGAIQSALLLQYGKLITSGKPSDAEFLVRDNPFEWLQKKPSNYSGEFYDPTPQSSQSGNWLFDLDTRNLVYLVRNSEHFKAGMDGKKWIRFHVVASYEQSRLPSQKKNTPELTGLVFEPVAPYSWF